ncbi:MAG TPA: NUDIX hydrolase [Patescibacteria group bacterium]
MSFQCLACDSDAIQEVVQDNYRFFYCSTCEKLYERASNTDYGKDLIVNTKKGIVHVCVGALIRQNNKFLLIKRRAYPFGYGFPAGHLEYEEQPQEGLAREVFEETGLRIKNSELLFNDFIPTSKCRYGADNHIWYFYAVECEEGVPVLNPESEGIGWFSMEEAKNLNLIPSAQHLLTHITFPDPQ